jgi:hypothetical protein
MLTFLAPKTQFAAAHYKPQFVKSLPLLKYVIKYVNATTFPAKIKHGLFI